MLEHFGSDCAALYDAAVGSKVASQHCDTACYRVRIVDRSYYLSILILYARYVLADSLACAGDDVGIEKVFLGKFVHYSVNAACLVKVFHIGMACGGKVAKVRSLCRDSVCYIKVKVYAAFMCYSGQMEHRVCGAAECHINGKGIHESLFCHYVTGTDILSVEFHHLHTGCLCELYPFGIYSGDSAVSSEAHAENFGKAVH